MTTRTRRTRKNNTPKVAPQMKRNFEDARNTYLKSVAAYDVLSSERAATYKRIDPTGELCEQWIETGDEPAEITDIEFECSQLMSLRTQARNELIAVAEELTTVLASHWRVDASQFPKLFTHLRMRPFSEQSRKVIDLILRLEVR